MRKAKETKLTGAWFARVYSLTSRKSRAEAVRLAGMLGVTTAEGFLRLREPRRRYIVELARMRGGTHPLKELNIMLSAAVFQLTSEDEKDVEGAHELTCDAADVIDGYFNMFGFDHAGEAPDWFSEAEDGIALGLKPPSKRKPCRPGACDCDMATYQDA